VQTLAKALVEFEHLASLEALAAAEDDEEVSDIALSRTGPERPEGVTHKKVVQMEVVAVAHNLEELYYPVVVGGQAMEPATNRSGVLAGIEDPEGDLPKPDFDDQNIQEFQFLKALAVAYSGTYQPRILESVDIAEEH
jgi:hypothetical protein